MEFVEEEAKKQRFEAMEWLSEGDALHFLNQLIKDYRKLCQDLAYTGFEVLVHPVRRISTELIATCKPESIH